MSLNERPTRLMARIEVAADFTIPCLDGGKILLGTSLVVAGSRRRIISRSSGIAKTRFAALEAVVLELGGVDIVASAPILRPRNVGAAMGEETEKKEERKSVFKGQG